MLQRLNKREMELLKAAELFGLAVTGFFQYEDGTDAIYVLHRKTGRESLFSKIWEMDEWDRDQRS